VILHLCHFIIQSDHLWDTKNFWDNQVEKEMNAPGVNLWCTHSDGLGTPQTGYTYYNLSSTVW